LQPSPLEILSRLTLLPLNSLRPHEECREDLVSDLARDIQARQIFMDPVIVDEGTLVVLDGTHRLGASGALGLTRIPAYLVHLESDMVKVGRWFRATRLRPDLLTKLGVEGPYDYDALASVDRRECSYAVVTAQGCYLSKIRPMDIWHAYAEVKAVDRLLRQLGLNPTYIADYKVSIPPRDQNIDFIYTAPVSKSEVLLSALHGRLLPHKSTRHVVDMRPIGLNIPLRWLTREVSEPQARDAFRRRLDGVKPRALPAGETIGGRVYQESVVVLG
jgi:hypothetical protein